jgi:diacylglycerol kinase family enzyme
VTRALLITNPAAARTDARAVTAVRETLRDGGWEVEVLATTRPGDARRFAELARTESFDAVVCYGGDGTAMQAAAGLVGSDVPLGLVAGGTGNLLVGNLRLPRDPAAAARLMLRGKVLRLDLGAVQRSDGLHYFAVCSGAGFDAALMARTKPHAKQRWRMGAYIAQAIAALPAVHSVPHRITVDGDPHEVRAAMVLVCNCGELMPPFLRVPGDVRPNDGWLNVVTMRGEGALESAAAFFELLRGGSPNGAGRVWTARGRTVRVELAEAAGPPQPVQLDGEVAGVTPFETRLVPAALNVLVDPATVPGGVPTHG